MNTSPSHTPARGFAALKGKVAILRRALQRRIGQVNALKRKKQGVEDQNRVLRTHNKAQGNAIVKAQADIRVLRRENKLQGRLIDKLKEDLRLAKLPVNSSNSSRPPSTDLYTPGRNRSLRQSSGRKSGGQPGHRGTNRPFSQAAPDKVVEHGADYCAVCGKSLEAAEQKWEEVRQVVDIPKPKPFITNHWKVSRICSCGHCNTGRFPDRVKSTVSYGSGVEALLVNLSARQYIPYGRSVELLEDLFGLTISQGTVDNILSRFSGKAQPLQTCIQHQISKAPVAGSDETGIRVKGKKGWFHTYQNEDWTFIGYHPCRGSEAQQQFFPQGLPKSTLVSDCWASQLSTPALGHQACMSHLLRELKAMGEAHPAERWPQKIKALFTEALELRDTPHDLAQVDQIEKRFERLLNQNQSAAPGKIPAFWKRLNKHRDKIFTFLHDDRVPADNNGSERAIRNVKVKQKVSGQFRTPKGATIYAVNRSIIDTLAKQNKKVHENLIEIAGFESG